mgnify:CR=1 FL=1
MDVFAFIVAHFFKGSFVYTYLKFCESNLAPVYGNTCKLMFHEIKYASMERKYDLY